MRPESDRQGGRPRLECTLHVDRERLALHLTRGRDDERVQFHDFARAVAGGIGEFEIAGGRQAGRRQQR